MNGKVKEKIENKEWPLCKRYWHFDNTISENKKPVVIKYIQNPENIIKHKFLPFIEKIQRLRKFNKVKANSDKLDIEEPEKTTKDRPLKRAGHLDSQIFSYYRILLSEMYEQKLEALNIGDSVLAYRSILNKNGDGKCNIDFFKEARKSIESVVNSGKKCAVLTLDVKDFFESLDHKKLKSNLRELFIDKKIPDDYYQVFNALTKYSSIKEEDIYKAFTEAKEIHTEQDQNKKRYSSNKKYRELLLGCKLGIKKNNYAGVPQGAPLSDLLANIYMLNFDLEVKQYTQEKFNGTYFRYSDDILFLFEGDKLEIDECYSYVKVLLSKLNLTISPKKTTKTVFFKAKEEKIDTICYSEENWVPYFSYLGLVFENDKNRIRSSSLSKLHRKANRALNGILKAYKNQLKAQEIKKEIEFNTEESNDQQELLILERKKLSDREFYVNKTRPLGNKKDRELIVTNKKEIERLKGIFFTKFYLPKANKHINLLIEEQIKIGKLSKDNTYKKNITKLIKNRLLPSSTSKVKKTNTYSTYVTKLIKSDALPANSLQLKKIFNEIFNKSLKRHNIVSS